MSFDPANCRCWETPFRPVPPCYEICGGRILREASPEDLVSRLNFSRELAIEIGHLADRKDVVYLSDFKPFLAGHEFEEVETRLRNLSPDALSWLKKLFEQTEDASIEQEMPVEA